MYSSVTEGIITMHLNYFYFFCLVLLAVFCCFFLDLMVWKHCHQDVCLKLSQLVVDYKVRSLRLCNYFLIRR